ncbi:MAG: patatin-like phospholipase family protein [Hydrogenophaga sp.]|nr:patatin-like phospholipase family protein [Hydrogenophaga sp.]
MQQILTQTRIVLNKFRVWALMPVVLTLAACTSAPTVPEVAQPTAPTLRTPTWGLALGGGAARGFAHVGVLQVLEENGLRPTVVTGTSAGSLVAAMYATGMKGAELERLALGMEEATLTDWSLPILGRGVLRGEALERYVRQAVGGRNLENMALPLGILATDLQNGRGVLFRRGDAAIAVRASSAVPGVFTPVLISGREYVDGGLVAPVPVSQAREMGAEVVLAVDISKGPELGPVSGALSVLLQTFDIMGQSINRYELAKATVVIRPALVGVGSADFGARAQSIAAGRAAMQAALPALRQALQPR